MEPSLIESWPIALQIITFIVALNDGPLVEDYVRVFVVKSFIEYVESNM